MTFLNRQEAGQQLAEALRHLKDEDAVVLALPRGGAVVGAEVARGLGLPLGLVLVRKIGHPSYDEYAIGAIAENDKPRYDEGAIAPLNPRWLTQAETSARAIIAHRRDYYGDGFKPPTPTGTTAIIVDDGIATGLTMEAAVRAVRRKRAKRVIVAVPVAPLDSVEKLKELADEVIVLDNPAHFLGNVGAHYDHFEQIDDKEVRELLWEVNDGSRHTKDSSAANDQATVRSL